VHDWNDIRRWRRARREELKARRRAMSRAAHRSADAAIIRLLREQGPALHRFAFYWPMYGEPDLRPLATSLLGSGAEAALPVVVDADGPLEFWRWDEQTPLSREGAWQIPIPAERLPLRPKVLLIPTLGFDAAGYRLGYGGGYYDRTLAALTPRPLAVGIAYELGRLETIYPQPHDIPLDLIVTEAGLFQPAERFM
jgi:5,10-methenyltetrahydrofolate synthetase